MTDRVSTDSKWRRMIPEAAAYFARLVRTVFLIAVSPTSFCREVMNGEPPPRIVSSKALIGALFVLTTVLTVIFWTPDEEQDISWFLPLSLIKLNEPESFERIFPGLGKMPLSGSFAGEAFAALFGVPRGRNPVSMHLRRILSEKVTWNALERYIATKDADLAARYHSLTWTMELGVTFQGRWKTVEPILFWYLVGLVMHLSLPARNTSIREGIRAQQYVIFGFILSYGLPTFVFMYYYTGLSFEQRVASTTSSIIACVLFGTYLLAWLFALRAIAKAYKYSLWVVIGVFCLIAKPIASAAAVITENVCEITFIVAAEFKNKDAAAAVNSIFFETIETISRGRREEQTQVNQEFGVGLLFDVRPGTGAIVTGLIRNSAAHVSGEIKVGDTITMVKKTPDSAWIDLATMDQESIRTAILGERNTEVLLLVKSGSRPTDDGKEVSLRRKRLYRVHAHWLEVVD